MMHDTGPPESAGGLGNMVSSVFLSPNAALDIHNSFREVFGRHPFGVACRNFSRSPPPQDHPAENRGATKSSHSKVAGKEMVMKRFFATLAAFAACVLFSGSAFAAPKSQCSSSADVSALEKKNCEEVGTWTAANCSCELPVKYDHDGDEETEEIDRPAFAAIDFCNLSEDRGSARRVHLATQCAADSAIRAARGPALRATATLFGAEAACKRAEAYEAAQVSLGNLPVSRGEQKAALAAKKAYDADSKACDEKPGFLKETARRLDVHETRLDAQGIILMGTLACQKVQELIDADEPVCAADIKACGDRFGARWLAKRGYKNAREAHDRIDLLSQRVNEITLHLGVGFISSFAFQPQLTEKLPAGGSSFIVRGGNASAVGLELNLALAGFRIDASWSRQFEEGNNSSTGKSQSYGGNVFAASLAHLWARDRSLAFGPVATFSYGWSGQGSPDEDARAVAASASLGARVEAALTEGYAAVVDFNLFRGQSVTGKAMLPTPETKVGYAPQLELALIKRW